MTDVVTHADPSPGDGRRPGAPRRHRARRGLRTPATVRAVAGPATAATAATEVVRDTPVPAAHGEHGGHRARHRRGPDTAPTAVPTVTGAGPSRHRAAHPGEAFDPATVPIVLADLTRAPARTGDDPVTTSAPTAAPEPVAAAAPAAAPVAASVAAPLAAPAAAAGPELETTDPGDGPGGTSHAAPRRRGLPLRATIGLIGGGGVAALFALTSTGSPAPGPAPVEPLPSAAAPAGLYAPALPGPQAPSALPVVPVAPPAVSTTATPEGPEPVIGALFDAAAGAFSDLFDNSANDGLVENGPRPRIVANPDAPGRQAWQFSLGPGGKRSEVLPQGPGTEPVDGDEQYIRYTAQLSDDFPTDTDNWQVILQWHHTSPNGSPPLALQVTRGQLYMVSNGDDMKAIGPVSPGDRVDLTMHVKFSQDPGESSVTVWRDGRPTGVTGWSPRRGTMSTHAAYLKMGMYRAQAIRANGSVLVTDLKIGRDARGIGGIGPRPVD